MEYIDTKKHFYRSICNESEIDRIFDIKNGADYLLKIRADTIVDHMRLYRVYRNKALADEKNWSLEGSFDQSHYEFVLSKLDLDQREACKRITYGDIFSNDPNGLIFNSEFGVITTISDSLTFFLKFCHLALMDFESEVPMDVRFNSLRIAIRTMLKTESMDFLMDPRGIIPSDVAYAIHSPIKLQKQFIAGHEFAHFILGHLVEGKSISQPVFHAISPNDDDYKAEKVFNNSQKNEFEADVQSILLPDYSDLETSEILESALLWFGCLELHQAACDAMFPTSSWGYKSHPSARERYDNLLTKIPTPRSFDTSSWKDFHGLIDQFTKALQEDISINFDDYEKYGSTYLAAPDTRWRGKELIDRVDYY